MVTKEERAEKVEEQTFFLFFIRTHRNKDDAFLTLSFFITLMTYFLKEINKIVLLGMSNLPNKIVMANPWPYIISLLLPLLPFFLFYDLCLNTQITYRQITSSVETVIYSK